MLSTKQPVHVFPMWVLLSAPKLCLIRKGKSPLASQALGGPWREITLLLQDGVSGDPQGMA